MHVAIQIRKATLVVLFLLWVVGLQAANGIPVEEDLTITYKEKVALEKVCHFLAVHFV